jgi:hypothetical protein
MNTLTPQLDHAGRRRRLRVTVAAAISVSVLSALTMSAADATPASALAPSPRQASRSHPATVITVYAFSINATGRGFIAAPGTNPKMLSPGDEDIVNDQLTVTHELKGGYPIIGHDSGSCTFSRIIDPHQGLANCVATAVLKQGSLTAQGAVAISSSGVPVPSDLAITGGTGEYAGAAGTLHVTDTRRYEIFTITLP